MWAISSLGLHEERGLFAFLRFYQLASIFLFLLFPSDCVALRFLDHTFPDNSSFGPVQSLFCIPSQNTPTIQCPHLAVVVMHQPPDATTFQSDLHARSVLD